MSEAQQPSVCSFKGLLLYFLRLGATGFGGPIALVALMERELVQARAWVSREEFERGFALAQLAPGPVATQLAMYIGYLRRGVLGATLVSFAFLLPSFLMVVVLGWFYVLYGGLPWVHAVFASVGAAVIGIIVRSAYKLTRSNLKKHLFLWGIAAVLALLNVFTHLDNIWLFLLAGGVAIVVLAPPAWSTRTPIIILPMAMLLAGFLPAWDPGLMGKIFLFFAKAGAFVYGSGLTIVPFLHGGVVNELHWLTEQQFLDAVAVAMITPGPVVITVGFIGYLVGGFPGAVAAAVGVFLPVYLFVVIAAQFVERIAHNPRVMAFVKGITAAATGAIVGSVVVLAREAITDLTTAIIAAVTLVLITRGKVPDPVVIAAAALVGLALHAFIP
jgi:chromate transporter